MLGAVRSPMELKWLEDLLALLEGKVNHPCSRAATCYSAGLFTQSKAARGVAGGLSWLIGQQNQSISAP